MARERSLYFLELIGKDAPPIPSYNVLEGNAGDTQTAKRRTPKCRYCTALCMCYKMPILK